MWVALIKVIWLDVIMQLIKYDYTKQPSYFNNKIWYKVDVCCTTTLQNFQMCIWKKNPLCNENMVYVSNTILEDSYHQICMSTLKSKHHKESKYISHAFWDPSPIRPIKWFEYEPIHCLLPLIDLIFCISLVNPISNVN